MKHPSFVLGSLILATACSRSATDPTPVTPALWQGTVKYTRHIVVDRGIDQTETVEGPVVWRRDSKDLDPLKSGGANYLIQSGSVTVTTSGGPWGPLSCTSRGSTRNTLKPSDGFLTVSTNGTYSGYLRASVTWDATTTCVGPPATSGVDHSSMTTALEMSGVVADMHVKGEMPPVSRPWTTITGSWDFVAQ